MRHRRRGLIVNVSSLAGLVVAPTMTPYAVCKAGISHFSAGLQRELTTAPVDAMVVQLGFVEGTDMMNRARGSTSAPIEALLQAGDRFHGMPVMTVTDVADGIVGAIREGRHSLVLPTRMAPLHHIRELPNRINDLMVSVSARKVLAREPG